MRKHLGKASFDLCEYFLKHSHRHSLFWFPSIWPYHRCMVTKTHFLFPEVSHSLDFVRLLVLSASITSAPPIALFLSLFTVLFMLDWFYSAAEASLVVCVYSHESGFFLECICVCRPFSILLGTLICFGSVQWAGHKANYVLKGKSDPNELQR